MNLHARLSQLSPEKRLDMLNNTATYLAKAGQSKRLKDILSNLQFVEAKINDLGVQSLLSDFSLPTIKNDPTFTVFNNLIKRKKNLFDQCESLEELISTLQTQVVSILELKDSILAREPYLPPYYLTSQYPELSQDASSDYLEHTLIAESTECCAMSPNDDWIAYGTKNLLKVWDLKTEDEKASFVGHKDIILDCAVSPKGDFIVSASADNTLIIWDVATGDQIKILEGHLDSVAKCRVSSSGDYIVSTSYDGTLKVWDSRSGIEKLSIKRFESLSNNDKIYVPACCDISPNQKFVVFGARDGLEIWNIQTGIKETALPMITVSSCSFITDNSLIISTGPIVKIYDFIEKTETLSLDHFDDIVSDCTITPDRRFIISTTSVQNSLYIWDTSAGDLITELFHIHAGIKIVCSPVSASNRLVTCGGGTVKSWHISFDTLEYNHVPSHCLNITSCTPSPLNDFVLTTSYVSPRPFSDITPQIAIWNSKTGTEFFTILIDAKKRFTTKEDLDLQEKILGHNIANILAGNQEKILEYTGANIITVDSSRVTTAQYMPFSVISIEYNARLPNGGLPIGMRNPFLTCSAISYDGTIIVIGLSQGYFHVRPQKIQHDRIRHILILSDVEDCTLSPDNDLVISSSANGIVRLWDMETGYVTRSFQAHEKPVNVCEISPKGDFFVTGSDDHTLKIWGIAGNFRLMLSGHTHKITDCVISSDGKLLISSSWDKSLRVWDTQTGSEIRQLLGHGEEVNSCDICPLGNYIFSVSSHTLKVWETKSWECIASLRLDDSLSRCAVMADGRNVVVVGNKLHWIRLSGKQAIQSSHKYQTEVHDKDVDVQPHYLRFKEDLPGQIHHIKPDDRTKSYITNYIKHKLDIELQRRPDDLLLFLNNTGVHFAMMGELDQANNYLTEAYKNIIVNDNRQLESGIVLSNLGNLHQALGNLSDAQTYQELALQRFKCTESTVWTARGEYYLGNILYDSNNLSAALNHYHESMTLFNQTGDLEEEVNIRKIISYLNLESGNKEAAIENTKKLLNTWKLRKNSS